MKTHEVIGRFGADAMSGIKYHIAVLANISYLLPAGNAAQEAKREIRVKSNTEFKGPLAIKVAQNSMQCKL